MNKRGTRNRVILQAVMAVYVYLLVKIILFKFGPVEPVFLGQRLKQSMEQPRGIMARLREGNLTPFKEISRTFHVLTVHDFINLVGNVAIFIPFGIFIGLLSAKSSLSAINACLYSFGLSLMLELSQAVLAIGRFDVDDLLLNTCGGLIGCTAVRLCVWFMQLGSKVPQPGDTMV